MSIDQLTPSPEIQKTPETTASLELKIRMEVSRIHDVVHADAAINEVRGYIKALLADGEEFFAKYRNTENKHDPEVVLQVEESIFIYRKEWGGMTKWDRAKKRQIGDIREYFNWLSSKITEFTQE